jgi:hypothetical protein
MPNQITPEQRAARIRLGLNIAAVAAIAIVVGPFAVTILHGLGAILAIGATVGIAWVGMKFLGVFTMMISNAALKAMKHEAMKNPVETLQLQYNKKALALKDFVANIRRFIAQVASFEDQVKGYVKEGLEDAPVYVEQLKKMKQLLQLREDKYEAAKDALAKFQDSIDRTDKKWKMALAAAAMNEAAGEMEGDTFDKICIETAVNAVQDKLNESFADLEVALLDDDHTKKQLAAKQLNQLASPQPNNMSSTVVDVEATTVPVSHKKITV